MKAAEDNRNADRDNRKENQRDQIAGENVGPETNGERQQTGEVADQLNGKHQRGQQNLGNQRHAFHGRSEKVQQIFRSGMFETLGVVVEKSADGAAQGHNGNAGRRLKPRDQSNQVADQDEDEDDGEKRGVGFAVMADNFAALAEDKALKPLERMLQASGRFDRQARSHHEEERQQEREDEQLHRERIGDRRMRILGLDVERPQKRRDGPGEQVVQDFGKPELFRHEKAS